MSVNEKLSLKDLQNKFSDFIYTGELSPELNELVATRDSFAAEEQLFLYKNNCMSFLKDRLRNLYPTVSSLVGEGFFKTLMHHYIQLNPSRSGDLNEYGGEFAEFVSKFPAAQTVPYLADVARIEWSWSLLSVAEDNAAFELEKLEGIAPKQFQNLILVLQTAFCAVASQYPIVDIWELSQANSDDESSVSLDDGEQFVLLHRSADDVEMQEISAADYHFISYLYEGLTLMQAYEKTSENYEIDLQASLQMIVSIGLVKDCYLAEA